MAVAPLWVLLRRPSAHASYSLTRHMHAQVCGCPSEGAARGRVGRTASQESKRHSAKRAFEAMRVTLRVHEYVHACVSMWAGGRMSHHACASRWIHSPLGAGFSIMVGCDPCTDSQCTAKVGPTGVAATSRPATSASRLRMGSFSTTW